MVYSMVTVLCVEQPYKDEHRATALASQTKDDPAGVSWSAQLPPVPGPQAALPSLSFAFCRHRRWGESMFGGREQGQVTGELGEEADLSGEEFGQIKQGDVEGNEFS